MAKKIILSISIACFFLGSWAQKPNVIKDSTLFVGSVSIDTLLKQELMLINYLAVYDTTNWTEILTVSGYKLMFQAQGRYNQFFQMFEAKLSTRARNVLMNCHSGDVILIGGIRFLDMDNKEQKYPYSLSIRVR